jgi:hypothetical protein
VGDVPFAVQEEEVTGFDRHLQLFRIVAESAPGYLTEGRSPSGTGQLDVFPNEGAALR